MAEMERRKAVLADIAAMADLINEYAGRGIMLPRTAFELAESIRDFVVVYDGPTLVGCGAGSVSLDCLAYKQVERLTAGYCGAFADR